MKSGNIQFEIVNRRNKNTNGHWDFESQQEALNRVLKANQDKIFVGVEEIKDDIFLMFRNEEVVAEECQSINSNVKSVGFLKRCWGWMKNLKPVQNVVMMLKN